MATLLCRRGGRPLAGSRHDGYGVLLGLLGALSGGCAATWHGDLVDPLAAWRPPPGTEPSAEETPWTAPSLPGKSGGAPPGRTIAAASHGPPPASRPVARTAQGKGEVAPEAAAAPPEAAAGAASEPAPPVPPQGARVYGFSGLTKIHLEPDLDAPIIGAIRAGQSIPLKPDATRFERRKLYLCTDGWYAVEPRGYVCVGGLNATLDAGDPRVAAAAEALPDTAQVYPFRFGTSAGAPQYLRIPTKEEQRQAERGLDQYLASLPAPDPEQGDAIDATPAGKGPSAAFLRYQEIVKPPLLLEQEAYAGMKVSWARELDANGRTWLLTPNMTLVPKDKVRVGPVPAMQGVDLRSNPQMKLPLAFLWLEDAVVYRRDPKGELVETAEKLPRHSFWPTTGRSVRGPGGIYWELRGGDYIKYALATIIKKADARPNRVGPKDKWIRVRVTWGYLVAYEGSTPVYATAVSPGIDGISKGPYATKRGRHVIGWKMLSADMDGRDKGKDWFVDEVPWTQYYVGSYALHGAWWHDEFGRPKSHGCVNLPPADARWLFGWTDPVMPEGWYAVTSFWPQVKGTLVELGY
ncbi:MAG: L,D-transpeptidase [Deltaproteobacteria bacterium]|nr:L,D-transpeptidase [Deltaproteobacteria bacterium]